MCEPQYTWTATIQESPGKVSEELVTKLYKEPEDGKFEDVTDEVLEGL